MGLAPLNWSGQQVGDLESIALNKAGLVVGSRRLPADDFDSDAKRRGKQQKVIRPPPHGSDG